MRAGQDCCRHRLATAARWRANGSTRAVSTEPPAHRSVKVALQLVAHRQDHDLGWTVSSKQRHVAGADIRNHQLTDEGTLLCLVAGEGRCFEDGRACVDGLKHTLGQAQVTTVAPRATPSPASPCGRGTPSTTRTGVRRGECGDARAPLAETKEKARLRGPFQLI